MAHPTRVMSVESPPEGLEGTAGLPEPASDDARPQGRRRRKGEAQPEDDDAAAEPEPVAELAEPAAAEAEASDAGEQELEAGAGERLTDDELVRRVAALLFASPHPLSPKKLAELLERPRAARVQAALNERTRRFEAGDLPFELRRIAGGWHLFTAPDQGEVVARLAPGERSERLSPAGLETLAVVAYRQPVTKAEIEAIRGVQAGPMLRSLVDRGLVKVLGRADLPGSPLQYGTTRDFLDRFGLGNLEDLPRDGELL